ncbi:hypothetical protein BDY17DRAFT_52393 [Neohortaea acidophila]|uniref:Secreted protein n=1 Tax=Neohortaea acidophila TaxID=245834 RepID=A0A6A6PHM7_9PEZI|nr:uncharacterized protein BDY17DRAFT_52393 [Neohortaea acidophila]KAF2479224.1 hypothetical protein BDY17DRAFT_52393 [Neohortaea acidophila]
MPSAVHLIVFTALLFRVVDHRMYQGSLVTAATFPANRTTISHMRNYRCLVTFTSALQRLPHAACRKAGAVEPLLIAGEGDVSHSSDSLSVGTIFRTTRVTGRTQGDA